MAKVTIWDEVKRIDSTNPKAIDKAIKALPKSGRKFALAVHAALVAAVEHSVAHSDASKVTALWEALASYSNKRGIQAWLTAYTHLTMSKDKAGVAKFLGRDPEKGTASYIFLLEGADIPFFDMPSVKSQDDKAWDFVASAYAMLTKAEKAAKEGKLDDKGKRLLAIFKATIEAEKAANANTFATPPAIEGQAVTQAQAAA